ncbi:uncharacterized protein [Montipora capricornis]|uniref:uncharacterized protein isoform X3 n=1 Tax=Montipora capricornis TaxID=246305 RepID=UPI0035F16FC8
MNQFNSQRPLGRRGIKERKYTDECQNSPCQNGATCVNKPGRYECKCIVGYNGKNCDTEELGCFKDKAKDRTMDDHMLESLRKYIDWRDMSKTVRNCSEIAKRKKKYYFAIQYYGECWGASADTQYNKHGPSDNCWSGVGGPYTNFVYRNTDV